MKNRNLKIISNSLSRKKRKDYKEYSKFEIIFSTITVLILLIFYIFFHPTIFQFFDKSVYVIIGEFWFFTITIFTLQHQLKFQYLENKFSHLCKDLSNNNNISYRDLITSFPNYDKREFLEEHKFEENEIISYLRYKERKYNEFEGIDMTTEKPEKIFKISCSRKINDTNYIDIYLLDNKDGLFADYNFSTNSRLLENYVSIEKLISLYHHTKKYE